MVIARLDFGLLLKSLCFIKVLEWIFAIFAFGTCGGFQGGTTLLVSCQGMVNKTVTAAFAYSFSAPDPNFCGGIWTDLEGNFSSAQFFITTLAVLVFLYCFEALVVYMGYKHVYDQNRRFPLTVFGLINMILREGNIWFVHKDTNLHNQPNRISQSPAIHHIQRGV